MKWKLKALASRFWTVVVGLGVAGPVSAQYSPTEQAPTVEMFHGSKKVGTLTPAQPATFVAPVANTSAWPQLFVGSTAVNKPIALLPAARASTVELTATLAAPVRQAPPQVVTPPAVPTPTPRPPATPVRTDVAVSYTVPVMTTPKVPATQVPAGFTPVAVVVNEPFVTPPSAVESPVPHTQLNTTATASKNTPVAKPASLATPVAEPVTRNLLSDRVLVGGMILLTAFVLILWKRNGRSIEPMPRYTKPVEVAYATPPSETKVAYKSKIMKEPLPKKLDPDEIVALAPAIVAPTVVTTPPALAPVPPTPTVVEAPPVPPVSKPTIEPTRTFPVVRESVVEGAYRVTTGPDINAGGFTISVSRAFAQGT